MKKIKLTTILTVILASFLVVACGKVLITGRNQLLLYSQGDITALSDQAYTEIMSDSKISTNRAHNATVKKVGEDLTRAVESYLTKNGWQKEAEEFDWKYEVIQSDQVNAFCLPNGNIVFYEGIMKITNTPDLVAVVMGHEIAHALAKHGNERMSQEVMMGMAGQAISAFIGSEDQKKQMIFQVAFGLGSQLGVLLPYSRKHEYEADRLGLIIMAMAGYNINVAPGFWEKKSSGAANQSDFFSTHPSDEKRVAEIKKILPEAAKYKPVKN